jgi:hypothetical protein
MDANPWKVFHASPWLPRTSSCAQASLLALGSSCELPPLVLSRNTFFRASSHEVLRLHSTCGAIDPKWTREPDLTLGSFLHSAPPPGFDHPPGGLIPIVPCAAAFAARSAREIHPSELSLDQNGTGFPASALLRFLGGVPYARCGSVSGLRFPVEVPRGPGSTFRFSLGFSLWGLLRRPGCRFGSPVPSSCALFERGALRRRARGALECCVATQSASLAARQPLWALRPCGHAGFSPRAGPESIIRSFLCQSLEG